MNQSASERIYLNPYSAAVLAAPVCEVQIFSTQALDEHEQIGQHRGLRRPPSGWATSLAAAQLRSPDVMSSAEASNSWCDRIGVAP
jgi:hypothetical protein